MRALSIRQPFAELILRGTKTIEYRTRPTRIIGERFWIYAAKGPRTKSPSRPMLPVTAPPALTSGRPAGSCPVPLLMTSWFRMAAACAAGSRPAFR